MPRKQSIIIFPKLNDRGGDLTRKWYVEWKWRMPGESDQRIERHYKGLAEGTDADRRKIAKQVIKDKTEWLKSGAYLKGNQTRVYADELLYRNEAKMFGEARAQVVTTRTNLSEFLIVIKQKVNKKSYENYVSKLRIFNAFLKSNRFDELSINNLNRQHIIDFSVFLSSNQKLSRLTIKKYIQIIHTFFDFELDRGNIATNPAERIPAMGIIVDQAAVPFQRDERIRLKEAIEKKDPQLWLACEIQYYCAIRPGTELRLMRIGWIDFDRKKFRIPSPEAKNSLIELVDIPEFLFEKLINLKQYNPDLYLFGKYGQPNTEAVGKNTLRNRFNRYRDEIGISPDRKFYSWKHTGAIQLLDNGVQPHDLQGHLRHKSFSTTEVYIKKRAGSTENKVTRYTSEI
ncbi:MAG TPA: tyrosine-type recombinase/integrase [Paludibacter sp.]|nr:tyrosine-type recombinase/integrase [Paludibacter sp.]